MKTVTLQDFYCLNRPWVMFDGGDGGFHSKLFSEPIKIITANNADQLPAALDAWDEAAKTLYCAGYISYEAGYALQGLQTPKDADEPLLWIAVFEKCEDVAFDFSAADPQGDIKFSALRTYEEYAWEISRIKKRIAAGDTYQVNYSFPLEVYADDSVAELYARLAVNQQARYRAVLRTGDCDIVSLSPELFFEKKDRMIKVSPMKGTAPRGVDAVSDIAARDGLASDEKNTAENLMIVDLMRNDLGKIAETGSVRVTSLFDVETHATLHQMTSTVEAKLHDDVSYRKIIEALFPCGSVTGAPKRRSMEIIRSCERESRGAYCGAIGYSTPAGDAKFSVAIRTLVKKAGPYEWSMRVGSGIVWDSATKPEWDECLVKAAFVTKRTVPAFSLIETILFDGKTITLREEHLARLADSAAYFGYSFDRDNIEKAWDASCKEMRTPGLVRSLLDRQGAVTVEVKPLVDRGVRSVPFSPYPIDSKNVFMYHKTSYRPWYDAAMERIAAGEVFDVLFVNESGEVCEGAISNVFASINGKWYTPPVSCGLLNGTLRRSLIAKGFVSEKVLFPRDLRNADAVYCGNAVRGQVKVTCLF